MNESIETKEKHNVVWIFNGKIYSRICDTLEEAMRIREKIIRTKAWTHNDVSIHLIQINKFGDSVVI